LTSEDLVSVHSDLENLMSLLNNCIRFLNPKKACSDLWGGFDMWFQRNVSFTQKVGIFNHRV